MKKFLSITSFLVVLLIAIGAQAQGSIDLKEKQYTGISEEAAAPPTWDDGNEYVYNTGFQNAANNMCIAQADANCNLFVAPGAGIIWEVRIRDGNGATLADVNLMDGAGIAITELALTTVSAVYGDNTGAAGMIAVQASQAGVAHAVGALPIILHTGAWTYGIDFNTGNGIPINAQATQLDDASNLNNSLNVTGFTYGYDATAGAWDRIRSNQYAAALAATQESLHVISSNYFYDLTDGTMHRFDGDELSSDAVVTTTHAPYMGSMAHYLNVDDDVWQRLNGGDLDNETIAETQDGIYTLGFGYAYDEANTTWRWLNVIPTHADDMPTSRNGLVTASVMYGYDGATLDMVRVGAAGEVQMTDVATRPGEDAGNDWRKVKKEDTATLAPAATTGTAVAAAAVTVLASTEVLSYPNFCIYLKNAGGGGGGPLTDGDIQVSPDGTLWVSIVSTVCDAITSGNGCVQCVSGNSYRYVRVQATAAAPANDTTVDAWITGNKG